MKLVNKTILVCGGAGFIGSNFIRYVLYNHPKTRVVNLDKLTYCGNLDNLKDVSKNVHYRFIKGDIADLKIEKVFKRFKPDYVVNFAAETHVDKSVHGRTEDFVKTNVFGVFNLLEIIKQYGRVKKFVQVSTDEVYGDLALDSKVKFKESDILKPRSPYSSTKASGDLICLSYFHSFGIPVVITRCGNNFGPYQYPEKLIPFFILRMLEGKKLPLYGDGKNVRDWIYVLDHCRAIYSCMVKGKPGEVYNIGAGNEKSNIEIAKMILRYFKKDESWIEFIKDRPGHDRRYALDASKIKKN